MRKSLVDYLKSAKKAVYITVGAVALMASSYTSLYSQTRTVEEENFDNNTTSRAYVEEDPLKWNIENNCLESTGFDTSLGDIESTGRTSFIWVDTTRSLQTDSTGYEVTLKRSKFDKDTEKVGVYLVVDGTQENPDNNNSYRLDIQAKAGLKVQYAVRFQNPGVRKTLINGLIDHTAIEDEAMKVKVEYNNSETSYTDSSNRNITPGWNLFITPESTGITYKIDTYIVQPDPNCEIDPITGQPIGECPTVRISPLDEIVASNAHCGYLVEDLSTDPLVSRTLFDNARISYNERGGGGRIEENMLGKGAAIPAVAKIFMRGDSNNDSQVNISDPIYTLNYLFLNGKKPDCLDAADSNDDGQIDVSDPIANLLHSFGGLNIPSPNADSNGNKDRITGIDTTEDELTNCSNEKIFN